MYYIWAYNSHGFGSLSVIWVNSNLNSTNYTFCTNHTSFSSTVNISTTQALVNGNDPATICINRTISNSTQTYEFFFLTPNSINFYLLSDGKAISSNLNDHYKLFVYNTVGTGIEIGYYLSQGTNYTLMQYLYYPLSPSYYLTTSNYIVWITITSLTTVMVRIIGWDGTLYTFKRPGYS